MPPYRNPLPKRQEIERQFRAKYDREMTAEEEKYFLLTEDIIEDSRRRALCSIAEFDTFSEGGSGTYEKLADFFT
jgi:hypothetical protein